MMITVKHDILSDTYFAVSDIAGVLPFDKPRVLELLKKAGDPLYHSTVNFVKSTFSIYTIWQFNHQLEKDFLEQLQHSGTH